MPYGQSNQKMKGDLDMSFLKVFLAVTVLGSIALAGDPKSGVAAL